MSLYSSYSDEQLLLLLRDSDESAFTELYNRYWAGIYRNAMKITGSGKDAEDIVQELFESIWKRRETIQITSSIPAYFHTSARYLAIHFIEKNITASTFRRSLSDATGIAMTPTIESAMDAKTMATAIDGIIETLPDKMKEIFCLSRKENLTHKEIAEKLNISEGTVKKQVYNALKLIRQKMNHPASIGRLLILIIFANSF